MARIVGRDGERIRVKLDSGTMLSVRPQEVTLTRRNPDGSNGIGGTLLLALGVLALLLGILLPVVQPASPPQQR